MAFASVGTLGGGGFKATQTTMTLTTSAAAEADNLVILVIALDNTAGDVAGSIVTSVTDNSTGGNLWVRGGKSTTAGAANNASASVWYCNVRNQIASAGTITANFSSRGAGGITAWEFTKAAGTEASLVGSNADTGAASAMLSTSLNVTTPNIEILRFRGGAGEEESVTTGTKTAAFTALIGVTGTSGTGGVATSNVICRGEYLISTATSQASLPTGMPTCDWSSVYIALREVPLGGNFSKDYGIEVPALRSFATIGT